MDALTGNSAIVTGSTSGMGSSRRKATNWLIEAMPNTSSPVTSLASPALPQGHDDPPEPGLLGCQSGRQNAADRPDPTIQPQLTEQHSAA